MATFDNPTVNLEKKFDLRDPHPLVNLADAYQDDMAFLNKMLRCDQKSPLLPPCEIDFDPARPGQKLMQVLEDRGFTVEFDKKERAVEISKPIKLEGNRLAELVYDRENGVHIELSKPVNHDHKLTLRARAALRAVRNVDDA